VTKIQAYINYMTKIWNLLLHDKNLDIYLL
jgi:hypothetical protein